MILIVGARSARGCRVARELLVVGESPGSLEVLEKALGRKARRQHMPLGVLRMMHAIARRVHPGAAFLLGLVLEDAGMPPEPADALVVAGRTRVAEVASRWARGEASGLPA